MFTVRDVRGLTTDYLPGRLRLSTGVERVAAPNLVTPLSPGDDGKHQPARHFATAVQRYIKQSTPEKTTPTAADIMTSPVESVSEKALLGNLIELFSEKRFRHCPVVDREKKIIGIVSDRLAFKEGLANAASSKADWRDTPLRTLMVSPVLTAAPHVPIREIARVLLEERIGCMPVTTDTGEPIGIITRSDLLRAIVAFAALELRI
jgi:CBS domain-containing protein